MRLTCPNCGAQYEVPDAVVPPEGRDVQCSNCGNTWFQTHPDHPGAASEAPLETAPDDPSGSESDASEPEVNSQASPEPVAAHDPDPGSASEPNDAGDESGDEDDTFGPVPSPERQEMDESVSAILRQEAAREAQLRAEEAASLETQPDLGLDSHPGDEVTVRAKQAKDRMAQIRGEPVETDPIAPESRRSLLPDIEEINSTLRSANEPNRAESNALAEPAPPAKRGSFTRGFAFALILVALLILVYANAPRIAQSVPQANPVLNAYVALVDQARSWLDATLGSALR